MLNRRHLLSLCAVGLMRPSRAQAEPQRRPWPADAATPVLELPRHASDTPWQLGALRGQVVLLNFWASWCEPCRDEMASLQRLAQRHGRDGLSVVAVNHRETDGAVQRYLAAQPPSHPFTLPILRDRDGAAARDWGVKLFPTTIAVDRRGRAAFSVLGEADWDAEPVRGWVAALL
ncbi:MAG: TlpA disulfide reductase family protein [Leptothrix sp. (in: b-proteobacteria)]